MSAARGKQRRQALVAALLLSAGPAWSAGAVPPPRPATPAPTRAVSPSPEPALGAADDGTPAGGAPHPAPHPRGTLDPLAAPGAGLRAPPSGTVRVRVVAKSSLERALVAGAPGCGQALAAELARLLRWRGDVARRVRAGDALTLLYVPHPRPTEPELLAVHYAGELLDLQAYRFAAAGEGIARFYDGDGRRVEPTMRHPPVPHYWQITETVQRGRGRRRHRGDDFRAPEGSPVVLPFAGRVTRTNWARRQNGRCIEVQLDAGELAHFLHLQAIAPEVRAGVHLPAGAVLGAVGNTGRSTGAHLHYELLRRGHPLEPLDVHGTVRDRLHGADWQAFVGWRNVLRARLDGDAPGF